MKKFINLLAIIISVVVISFFILSCDVILDNKKSEELNSSTVLKINGLPGNGSFTVYVFNSETNISTYSAITGAHATGGYQALGKFSSGNNFSMFGWNGSTNTGEWIGSGSLTVILFDSNGNSTDVNNPKYRYSTVNFANGNAEVHINNFSAVVEPVTDVTLTGIAVTYWPIKNLYFIGEPLELIGLETTAYYNNGSSKPVTGYITNPANGTVLSKIGTNTVQISYTEGGTVKNTNFNVNVIALTMTGISITNVPEKTVYFTGETLNLNGLVLTAFYNNGSSKPVTGFTTNPVNSAVLNNEGPIPIQVSYTEGDVTMSTSFNVTVDASQGVAGIDLKIEQIVDGAPIFGNITISRTGTGFLVKRTISVNASDFDTGSISWEVAGVGFFLGQSHIERGASIDLDASNTMYNSLGGHIVTLTVMKDGIQYQRAIPFEIRY